MRNNKTNSQKANEHYNEGLIRYPLPFFTGKSQEITVDSDLELIFC